MPQEPKRKGDQDDLEERLHELESANHHLSRANAQLVQFVNILANDVRSPLRHVMGFCRIVKHEYGGKMGSRGAAFLDNAVVSAKRIRELIDDLVIIARVQREEFESESFQLEDVVHEVKIALDAKIREANASFTHGRLPRLNASPELIRILIENLVENAIKYRAESRPIVHLEIDRIPDGWRMSISDNGIGIEPSRHKAIFDAFQRTSGVQSAYGNTGLGLFICKEIVERHGGRIWLESEVDQGTTFSFTLPDRA